MAGSQHKTFAEFFAGIGLVQKGLDAGGWKCVYANDLDPKKRELYEAEFGPSDEYHLEDIWNTDAVMAHLKQQPFLATASFPCVDLSLAGNYKGFAGERSSTYFGFLEVLKRMAPRLPKIVMLENVVGFLTARGGEDFRKAVTELAELGYWIDAIVLDAKRFVPQSRQRLFVFGFHRSLRCPNIIRQRKRPAVAEPWRLAMEHANGLRPDALQRMIERVELPTGWATTAISPPTQTSYDLAALIDLDDGEDWWDAQAVDKHYVMMSDLHRKRVDRMVQQKMTAVGTGYRRRRAEGMRNEVRFDNVAGCLRTPKGGSAKQIVVAIQRGRLRMRWMRPREYARLQGAGGFKFPDGMPTNQGLYGFGDAVCVPAIEWIDRNVLTPIYDASRAHARGSTDQTQAAPVMAGT